jgi:hypothetical protein
MDNPILAAKWVGARGHKLILDNFTWAHNAARHTRLYETLLTKNRHGQAFRFGAWQKRPISKQAQQLGTFHYVS